VAADDTGPRPRRRFGRTASDPGGAGAQGTPAPTSVLEVDLSGGDMAAACERIADWMTSTGGLWPRGRAIRAPRT